jgi:hypothetical protein
MRAILAVSLLVIAFAGNHIMADQKGIQFSPLTGEMSAGLDKQRAFVAQVVAEHFPNDHLTRTKDDFAVLQKIVDANIIKKDETWKLQALGVVFGDALLPTIDGLAWCQVSDEYGVDPTLRYRVTTLQLNVLTMISKRVEDGREVNLKEMADWLKDFVHKKASDYD